MRRFDNFVGAKGITNDTRIKAMMLHRAMQTPYLDTATHAFVQDAGNRRITELNAGLGGKSVSNVKSEITLQMSAGPLPQTLT